MNEFGGGGDDTIPEKQMQEVSSQWSVLVPELSLTRAIGNEKEPLPGTMYKATMLAKHLFNLI